MGIRTGLGVPSHDMLWGCAGSLGKVLKWVIVFLPGEGNLILGLSNGGILKKHLLSQLRWQQSWAQDGDEVALACLFLSSPWTSSMSLLAFF